MKLSVLTAPIRRTAVVAATVVLVFAALASQSFASRSFASSTAQPGQGLAQPAPTVHIAGRSDAAVPAAGPASSPPDTWSCGGERDVPNLWTPHSSGNASLCAGSIPGFSYILTSPSNQHFALYPANDEFLGKFMLEVWVPFTDAGQLAEYDYEVGGVWHSLGTVNQEANSSWYDIALMPQGVVVQQIRVRSVGGSPGPCGSTSCDLAEAAIGFRALPS